MFMGWDLRPMIPRFQEAFRKVPEYLVGVRAEPQEPCNAILPTASLSTRALHGHPADRLISAT
jgi:hypothetical protein